MLLLLLLLIIALLLEGTVTDLPLTLVCLLCLTIVRRDTVVFPVAFFAGFFLDLMTVHRLGGAGIFFLIFVFLILLYQRKYEINSFPFVFVSALLGSLAFLGLFGYGLQVGQALISSIIAGALFTVFKMSFRAK